MTRVVRDAPAARAGLRPGDVITSIDNRDIPTAAELAAIISAQQVGARVVVGVVRGGTALTLPLSVADRPATAKSPELARARRPRRRAGVKRRRRRSPGSGA